MMESIHSKDIITKSQSTFFFNVLSLDKIINEKREFLLATLERVLSEHHREGCNSSFTRQAF